MWAWHHGMAGCTKPDYVNPPIALVDILIQRVSTRGFSRKSGTREVGQEGAQKISDVTLHGPDLADVSLEAVLKALRGFSANKAK